MYNCVISLYAYINIYTYLTCVIPSFRLTGAISCVMLRATLSNIVGLPTLDFVRHTRAVCSPERYDNPKKQLAAPQQNSTASTEATQPKRGWAQRMAPQREVARTSAEALGPQRYEDEAQQLCGRLPQLLYDYPTDWMILLQVNLQVWFDLDHRRTKFA